MNLQWLILAGLVLGAYLLGSIPTGYLAGRLLKGVDLRQEGSGSTGATNVLRTLGKAPAIVVLLVDVLKGVGAVFLAQWMSGSQLSDLPLSPDWVVMLSGLIALMGHSKSVWLGFAGGKSVATGLGVLFALSWVAALSALGVFCLVLGLSRIVSLSSIAAAIATPIALWFVQEPLPYQLFGYAAGLYIIIRHQTNIQRLLAGTEPQIGQKLQTEELTPES